MEKEQIEQAARNIVLDDLSLVGLHERGISMRGFVTGARWRVNSVWHDPRKDPPAVDEYGTGDFCLIQTTRGDIDYAQAIYDKYERKYYFSSERETYLIEDVRRWAYVMDLIPMT